VVKRYLVKELEVSSWQVKRILPVQFNEKMYRWNFSAIGPASASDFASDNENPA